MSERAYWVYIMASERNGTLYVGVTNDLARRAWEHRTGRGSQFAAKYRVNKLVWCESYTDVQEAIRREKQLKGWDEPRLERPVRGIEQLSGPARGPRRRCRPSGPWIPAFAGMTVHPGP
jgi:putative endonuclease